jgi:hypothetical protein
MEDCSGSSQGTPIVPSINVIALDPSIASGIQVEAIDTPKVRPKDFPSRHKTIYLTSGYAMQLISIVVFYMCVFIGRRSGRSSEETQKEQEKEENQPT